MEVEFYSIEPDGQGGKQIHVFGYLYTQGEDDGDGEWRNVEYSGFIESIEDFIREYAEDEDYVDNTAADLKQYIDDYTDDEVVDIINNYFDGHPADYSLHYSELSIDTPCGNYMFETK
jgi:hypothetical protein